MPDESLIQTLLLPELSLISFRRLRDSRVIEVVAKKEPQMEYCPKCATPSASTYDTRRVRLKDEPFRTFRVFLTVVKRRLWCKPCGKAFTEPLGWVRKGHRHTERYGRAVMGACERYVDLKQVRQDFKCSGGWLYRTLYRHLELQRRKRLYPWPSRLGIDEHFFRRGKNGFREFVTVFVDQKNHRLMEVAEGRTGPELEAALDYIPGRENVRVVAIDMSDSYKAFVRRFFPQAIIVADKFHVLRLLSPAINKQRKAITGDKRSLPVRRLLLRNGHSLEPQTRRTLSAWLTQHPALRELYEAKEALVRFYRIRSFKQASRFLTGITDRLADSALPELQTLRNTLMRWRHQVLAYFRTRLTNGMTEGFNCKAKLVKRRAYGYRSFTNYRLRLLNACA
ncbi:MAG: ISL3 family transposase [Polyangiaceae bacterium]|nr:ISL3 family transposase [Polyangiaceae bacterium]